MKYWNYKIVHTTTFFILILCVLNIVLRLPLANLPAYADEIIYMDAVQTISNNNLNPFTFYWGYKPPFILLGPAILNHFIGPSRIWGRIEIFLFSSLALLFLYRLGKLLFPSKFIIWIPLILALFPTFMVHSCLFTDSIPFTALFIMTLFYYFSDNKIKYSIAATLLVMTKETGIFLPVLLLFYNISFQNPKSKLIKYYIFKYQYYFIPLCIFFLWLIFNKFTLGWYLALGFRWFEWDLQENRAYLNGKRLHLHGTNRHQEYPGSGTPCQSGLPCATFTTFGSARGIILCAPRLYAGRAGL